MPRALFGLLAAAFAAGCATMPTDPYRANWDRLRMDAPLRVLDTDKYEPTVPVAGAAQAEPLPTGAPLAETDATALHALAEATQSLALVVVEAERVRFAYYDGRQDIGPFTPFDSYNFHKTLLTLAFGRAIETGAVSLDDRAAQYIPAWRADGRRDITVRHLLNHESGLRKRSARFEDGDPVMDLFVGRDMAALVDDAPLAATPGSQFDFNHINAQALSFVLTRATGQRYEDILSAYLWQPLQAAPARVAYDRPGGDARVICCFLGTIDSWLRIGSLLASQGRFAGRQVVAPEWIAAMLSPAATNPAFGGNLLILRPDTERVLQSAQQDSYRQVAGPFAADDLHMIEASGSGRIYFVPSRRLVILRIGRFTGPFDPWDDGALVNRVLSATAED